MPRKSEDQVEEFVGLIGIGLDNQDEHARLTKGEAFYLVGGSEETHERMQDAVIHLTESLTHKGKRLQDASVDEVVDLLRNAIDR